MCAYTLNEVMEAEIDNVAIGARIRAMRKARGITMDEICDALGFNEPQAVYKWQRGDCLPTLNNLYKLSLLLGASIDEIVLGKTDREEGEERG